MLNRVLIHAVFLTIFLTNCTSEKINDTFLETDLNTHTYKSQIIDTLQTRHMYLPVYSQIYTVSKNKKTDLTATISIRNTDSKDSVFIKNILYYNTTGKLIRKYIDNNIYLIPNETLEIIIHKEDNAGGTGANFIFEWCSKGGSKSLLTEAVMISTSGQQGISFTSRGLYID